MNNDPAPIIAQALEEIKLAHGEKFAMEKVNLAELERMTGISRAKLRRLKKNGFADTPHGLTGRTAKTTVLSGFTGNIDSFLRKGVYNSSLIFEQLKAAGYQGGLSQVKKYMKEHKDLLPAKRQGVSSQGNRGRRYVTGPGESYEMDWGFVNVQCYDGTTFQVACFAMICHHCGERYVEFFPNAKQENLFVGMVHAFLYMGVPHHVLTDNMKSVVIRRDNDGHPIWQHDYEQFMKTIEFETKLCKPRHPFTKGAVERLVRFVKENFIAGRTFYNVTDLNEEALDWCDKQNRSYHRALDCIPHEKHTSCCRLYTRTVEKTPELAAFLCPVRSISFDGFVSYEGRRYGVPFWYTGRRCRVHRERNTIYIYDLELKQLLTKHYVTWSRQDCFCRDQYSESQPEESPSMPVKAVIQQLEPPKVHNEFSKFHFDEEDSIDG